MGFQEVGGKRSYPKFKETEPGTELVNGKFLREITGKYGAQFEFEQEDGNIVVLNGSGQLKYKMDFIQPNDRVKVVYEGEVVLDSGMMKGKTAHQFTVMRDSSYDSTDLADEDEDDDDTDIGDSFDAL